MSGSGLDGKLEELETAEISAGARAMLPVLAKMAHEAEALEPADFAPVRAAGVSEQAIVHALHVAYLFHIINRFAEEKGVTVAQNLAPERNQETSLGEAASNLEVAPTGRGIKPLRQKELAPEPKPQQQRA